MGKGKLLQSLVSDMQIGNCVNITGVELQDLANRVLRNIDSGADRKKLGALLITLTKSIAHH